MSLNPFLNSVEVFSATAAGTGTLTLGTTVSVNALTMAEAGATDGGTYVMRLDEPSGDFEIVEGVYTVAGGPFFTRVTVLVSKISGVAGTGKITATTNTACRIVAESSKMITRGQSMQRSWLAGG